MAYIHKDESALYYECGYSCDNAIFLKSGSDAWFVTDGRYETEAKSSIKNANVVITHDIISQTLSIIKKHKIKKCYFDPKEWSVAAFQRLSVSKCRFIPNIDMSHKKRLIKSNKEIKLLDKAAKIGAKSFEKCAKFFATEGIGLSEKRLAFEAERILTDSGKRGLSFEPIVAIGSNAALPHAVPTDRVLKSGDLLLMDAGIKYKRYCSDRTRTAVVDKDFIFDYSQSFGRKKIQKAYDTVLKAHDKAIEKARSGMRAKKIDLIAREVIEKAGFGKYFVHSTGHGVGLDIHEMPYISSRNSQRIDDNMVFTIEPGIYIAGKFGIRIEDTVVMENGRARVLGL